MKREFIMRKPCVILATLFCNNVNAEWGQQWGSMVWGQSSTNIPMMGGFGQLIFFGLLLVIGAFVTKRWGLIKTLPAIAVLSLMPLMVDADEIQLNTFQNGQVADADEVNENFNNLKSAVDSINLNNVMTRQITVDHNDATASPQCWGGTCYAGEDNKLSASISCQQNELALSGGCRIAKVHPGAWDDDTFASNYIENNQQNCIVYTATPHERETSLTAYINCLSR